MTLKTICSRDTAKNLSDFTNFPANMFPFGVRKNICSALFLDAQEPHSWSTLKANVCIFLHISVRKCLFQRRSKILSAGRWWINSLRWIAVWASWNALQFFIFIEIFENSTIFQHFDTFFYSSMKTPENFPDNSDFKGKIVAKFFIKSHFLSK